MVELQHDLNHLIEFLEFAKKNGYVNPGTANNRIRIAKEIFDTVPNVDTTDVTKLDIDEIFRRYTILTSNKLPSTTLQGNLSHLKGAIREFTVYLADRVHYKPESSRPKKEVTLKPPTNKPPLTKEHHETERIDNPTPPHSREVLSTPTIHIDFQIHISPDTNPTLVDKIFESLSKYFPYK
jgi:hypothetical protein